MARWKQTRMRVLKHELFRVTPNSIDLVYVDLWVNNRMFTSGHVVAPGASWTPALESFIFIVESSERIDP